MKLMKRINPKTKFFLSAFLPLMALLFIFRIFPIIKLFILSTENFYLKAMGLPSWMGFNHYLEIFNDELFLISLKNSLVYTGFYVSIVFIGSFLISLGLAKVGDKLRNNLILCYISPLMTNIAAAGVLFVYFFQPQFGLFNFILSGIHLPISKWLYDPGSALFSVVIMDIWRNIGFFTVLLLTGMLHIPRAFLEAAEVDGAGLWKKYWYVVIPLLKPTLLLVIIMCTINAMKVFEPIYVMTKTAGVDAGGPVNSTYVLSLYIYNSAFRFSRFGFGSAISVIFLIIAGVLIYLQMRFMRTTWEY